MKKFFLRALFILIPFLWSIYASSQPKNEDCSTTCFSSEVVSVAKISSTCSAYELRVSFSGACAHALSHFAVAVPCGNIDNVWNSQNWKQVIGTDPTTGLTGFKIDDISNFGQGTISSFTVKFTICAPNQNCAAQLNCWQPQVAYKASTCVNYETLTVGCRSLQAHMEKQDASCFGSADGSLSIVIDEGQAPYTFTWADQSTAQTRTGLLSANYSVVVRDASGSELTLSETIAQPEKIEITSTSTPASCNGKADGSIDISVSGGTAPFKFLWSNDQITEDLQSLPSNQYTVTVTDQRNCSSTATILLRATSQINVSSSHVNPDCGDTNGSIDLTISGGAMPYSFEWSNGVTTEDISGIGEGLYSVKVTDNAGCFQEKSFFIRENNTLTLKASTASATCSDEASGAVDLTVSGGTAPYSYSWSNGETTEDISGLTSGYYTVIVKDAKGCTVNGGYTISKTTFQVPKVVVQPSCHDDANGSITLQEPIGGTGPFSYVWSNGETGMSLTDLDAGTYSVTVTDATGCSRTLTATITNPAEITASAIVSNVNCNEEGSFGIDLTVSGGSLPYSYQWSNGSTTQDLSGLTTGMYTVVITDAHGCSISKQVAVSEETPTWSCLITAPFSAPVCSSINNSLSTAMTDADTYAWSVESTDGNWTLLGSNSPAIVFTAGTENSSATFTLTITKDGCSKTCSYTISACAPENNGGNDPGGENPGGGDPGDGGDETCEECFSSVSKLINASGNCRTYEMEVSTNGLCSHELSHWTLAIPCGMISNYSNSEGWKMEFGIDPTTGLYGLKVNDIDRFGKIPDSFTVRFTLCESGNCDLSYWHPTVAYKAGLCIGVETIEIFQTNSADGLVSVYPNPFNEKIQFEWNSADEFVNLEIIDQYGNTVSRMTRPTGKNESYYITLESTSLPKGMYYYRLSVNGRSYNGKISKR